MVKIGRNQPCPCGSGRKYKVCCGPRQEAADAIAEASERERKAAANAAELLAIQGRTEEAESVAHDLIQRYPDNFEGYSSLGLVHQLNGRLQAAADCYWKVLQILDACPDRYLPSLLAFHRHLAYKAQEAADIANQDTIARP